MSASEGSRGELLKILGDVGEEPAFIHRARSVEIAWEHLLSNVRRHREELLRWPRLRMGNLAYRLGNDWQRLQPFLKSAGDVAMIESLYNEWKPTLQRPMEWHWTDRSAFMAFVNSVEQFNIAWVESLKHADLNEVNRVRHDYNRYYPIEKDCAFGNGWSSLTFVPIEMITIDQMIDLLPPVPLPDLA